MRTLSSSLLTAQRRGSAVPYVQVRVTDQPDGVTRLQWTRLYTGAEGDTAHGMALTQDGSLVRARTGDGSWQSYLFRQTIASPGPGSPFNSWVSTGYHSISHVAVASWGAEVSIFFAVNTGDIYRLVSTNNGVTWGSPQYVTFDQYGTVAALAAAYKSNGDCAVAWLTQGFPWVCRRVGGVWQARQFYNAYAHFTGLSLVHQGDWNFVLPATHAGTGDRSLMSLILGDGSAHPPGTWGSLTTIQTVPSGEPFQYTHPFIAMPDTYRCFFLERFTGHPAYTRPFFTHTVPGTPFAAALWREPVPFPFTGAQQGLALGFTTTHAWLSMSSGVWRAPLAPTALDITPDVLSLKIDADRRPAMLTLELRTETTTTGSIGG